MRLKIAAVGSLVFTLAALFLLLSDRSASIRVWNLQVFHGVPASRAGELVRESDAIRAQMGGADGSSPGWALERRVREQAVTEAEIYAYYVANPELFGPRPLADCQEGIRRILQIKKTRESFEASGAQ